MTPNVDERLASVIRALTEVILPHLPPEASLAQEQAHLAIGQLQILRAQIDGSPAFEREELDDAIAIGKALAGEITGGAATAGAVKALLARLTAADGTNVRAQHQAINDAIAALVRAVATDGDAAAKTRLPQTILTMEHARAQKDRKWFAPFGFDSL